MTETFEDLPGSEFEDLPGSGWGRGEELPGGLTWREYMAVKLITDNLLSQDNLLSATEQEGEYVGQPSPASGNAGDIRLNAQGTLADETISGTATSNGAAGGTTVVDSVLAVFGDDYFIGATLTITSGACSGESKTVTDFARSTGTLTCAAFTAQIASGVTYTLTIPYTGRTIEAEIVAAGDLGSGTFKWRHDGTTWLTRDDPNQATWEGDRQIATLYSANPIRVCVCDAEDGAILYFYAEAAAGETRCVRSTDGGYSWGSPITVSTYSHPAKAIRLASGRILVAASQYLYCSDDNGLTWSYLSDVGISCSDMIELSNGNIIYVPWATDVTCLISYDGGKTWSDEITVSSAANIQIYPTVAQAESGDILCAYQSDEDSSGSDEIKVKRSTDGGKTWGAAADIFAFSVDFQWPSLLRDIDGSLYCAALKAGTGLVFKRSTDNGVTWGSEMSMLATSTYSLPRMALIHGHILACAYTNDSGATVYGRLCQRGHWEAFSAAGCPIPANLEKQSLPCGVRITWKGDNAVAGDHWDIAPAYAYSMKNILVDSPNVPWQSITDNAECAIILDMGANVRHYADFVAFFGCNVRTLTFQMNATNVWTSPSVTQAVSFDLFTGTLTGVDGNYLKAEAFEEYKDHQLAGKYIRMTSGTSDGTTFLIADNMGDWVVLDTTAAVSVAIADTFAVYQSKVACAVTLTTPYRYMRILIAAQQVYENYYKLGFAMMGRATTLTKAWGLAYKRSHDVGVEITRSPDGVMIPFKRRRKKLIFDLPWNAVSDTKDELASLFEANDGRNVVLIPDSGVLTDIYLCKLTEPVIAPEHRSRGYWGLSLVMEEMT